LPFIYVGCLTIPTRINSKYNDIGTVCELKSIPSFFNPSLTGVVHTFPGNQYLLFLL